MAWQDGWGSWCYCYPARSCIWSARFTLFVFLFPNNVDVHYIDVNASGSIEKGNKDGWLSQHWS
ncbi:hypothetical protein FP364_18055 [Citrobacter amalonaticus]|nr:hypothetical protein [Citrobacter amalonaticus]